MKIIKFQESHIDRVVELLQEFEVYLQSLSSGKRDDFDAEYQKNKLLKY